MLLKIEYDGTVYHGWQIQPNGITVQQTLCDALKTVLGKETAVTGCSRTDAGVHAKEFFCHLDCGDNIPTSAFLDGVNSVLPGDIAIKSAVEVPGDFHARYSAAGKTYVYNIFNSKEKDAFSGRYAWRIDIPLNIDKMNEFLKGIVGKHDFIAFSPSGRSVTDTVRTVSECNAVRDGDTVSVSITADGFLYNMVRIIVGSAVDYSLGRISNSSSEIIESKTRALAGKTAPPQGLFLKKVFYEDI